MPIAGQTVIAPVMPTRLHQRSHAVTSVSDTPNNVAEPTSPAAIADRLETSEAYGSAGFRDRVLRARSGTALASVVTQAGCDAGFTAEQVRVARWRCQPAVTSAGTPNGWRWIIGDATLANLAVAAR